MGPNPVQPCVRADSQKLAAPSRATFFVSARPALDGRGIQALGRAKQTCHPPHVKVAVAASLLLPANALAQSRGGSCNSAACDVTAALVLIVLLLLFLGSIYDSIREKGLLRGITTNRAARFVLGYIGMLVFVVGGSVAVEKLWGKHAAMWALGSLLVALVFGPSLLRRIRSRTGFAVSKEGQ